MQNAHFNDMLELAEKQINNILIYLKERGVAVEGINVDPDNRCQIVFRQRRNTEGLDGLDGGPNTPGHG